MHILLVDDAKETLDLYRMVFRLAGFRTVTAENGAQAVQVVQHAAEPFDAIVLDVEMPVMNGWQALSLIRQMPQGQHTPILMFTAYGNGELQARARQAGADRLEHKPLAPTEIIRIMQEMCSQN